jgi:hypothetical protein
MSDKYTCSVCGHVSELEEDFAVKVFRMHRPTILVKMIGDDDVRVCWACYLKALGVKPKEKSFTDKVCAEMAAKIIKDRPEILEPRNPCDTLTRQHTAEIENREVLKKFSGQLSGMPEEVINMIDLDKVVDVVKKAGVPTRDKSTFNHTLIPGCPAEEKKKAAMPSEGYSVISSKTLTVETFEFEIEKCKCMDNFELLEHVRANVKGKLIFDDIFVNPKKQNYFVVSGTRTYEKES